MALIHSLEICGVRNFSPDDKQTIDFERPVTLFLGKNGCGKTTIIECIKYALTGELPSGSNSGQGFLNDPQMSNKADTKGSIKITFNDADGNMITINRLIKVTTTAEGKLTFTTLNKPQDSSCTSLNVPKSILNNVLLCHQENSAWPLDQPSELNKKFDEIFGYTQYKKVVENVRNVVKDKQTALGNIERELTNLQRIKKEATAKMDNFNEMKVRLKEIAEKIGMTKTELEPLEKRKQEILVLKESLGTLKTELTEKDARRKGLIDQQSTIKKDISYVFEGSDEELQNKMSSFQSEQTAEGNAIKELQNSKIEITKKVEESDDAVEKQQIHIGQLKEEQKQYRKKLEDTKTLTERLRLSLELGAFPDVNDWPSVLRELQDALKKLEQEYNTLVEDKEAQELELQQRIDVIREESAGTRQMISSQNNSIVECQNKLKQIRDQLEELDTSDSQLRIVEDKIETLQATLTKLKSSFNESEKLQEIDELKEAVKKMEQFLDDLDREYRILQQNYVTEQKLDSEKSLIIEKQGEVARIKNKHSHNLQKLLGEDVLEGNFNKRVQDIQDREENKFKALTLKINKLEKELAHVETTLNHHKKKLENDQKELAFNKRKVSQLCGGKVFNEVLKETHLRKEILQKEKEQLSSRKIMYAEFIAEFKRESPCCPICQTDFARKHSAVNDIITTLRSKIELTPAELAKKESDLRETEDLYDKLQQLKPINEEIESLTDVKIPKMQEEINDLNEQFKEKSMELAHEKENLVPPQELIETCKRIITDATLLDQYSSDIVRANAAIAQLKQKIVKVASNRSRQETEDEIKIVKAKLSDTKNRYESANKMLDQHRGFQKQVQDKLLLEIQNTESNKKLAGLRTEVDELEDEFRDWQRKLKNAEEEQRSVVQTNKKFKDEEWNKMNENKNTLRNIQESLVVIDDYENNENDNKLDKAVEELERLKINKEKLEEAKNKVVDDISNKKESLAKKESDLRALKDNFKLRENQILESVLAASIEELEKKIEDGQVGVDDEMKRKEGDIDKKRGEISSMEGQQKEIEKQVSELEKQLAKPEIKNADKNYKMQYYEQAVMESAIEDLNKFVEVLRKSVLKFHGERMVDINRTIRELWRSIYRGNDIDYIEIKCDENITEEVNGKRRTNDYKVIQVKNNVKLEMRGRCSAGQKVLACLVIRMALAETFSAHCGILALDEPTTNLDRENILSLSDALSRIVTDREREKNFQLLIITHDKEFLRSLAQVQSLDSCWRVKRNQDGFSYVEKHTL